MKTLNLEGILERREELGMGEVWKKVMSGIGGVGVGGGRTGQFYLNCNL